MKSTYDICAKISRKILFTIYSTCIVPFYFISLQIINKEDSNWWQAKLWGVAPTTPAGLIPSPELQEWRTSMSSREKARHEHAGTVHVLMCTDQCSKSHLK